MLHYDSLPARIILRNGALLTIPPMIITFGLWGALPAAYSPDLFWRDIPPWLGLLENIFRLLVFGIPGILYFGKKEPGQPLGWYLYKQYVYFYLMKSACERIPQVVPAHVAYWKKAHLKDYRGGPFTDKTGGLILFTAADFGIAKKIAENDPFVLDNLIEASWVKEWIPE